MPELPEVETVRRGLAPQMEGRRILRAELRRPDLRIPFPPGMAGSLGGRRVLSVDRRAKYLLVRLDGGLVLIAHLGMSGRMMLHGPGADAALDPHDHVVLHMEGGGQVRFNDQRRFGLMTLAPEAELEAHPLLAGLGPEPLGNAFSGPVLAAALAAKHTPIKAALLDQRVVAGLGNIYVCEALYRSRLSPRRLALTVQGGRAERLAAAIRAVLGDAIAAGGSSLRNYVQADGELGYFQHAWAVYGRAGERCGQEGCGSAVRRIVQSGRSTFYCPRCQR